MDELKQHMNFVRNGFEELFQSEPEFISAAPGRINIIGEHTDYNYGLALPVAINRWVVIAAGKRNDSLIQVFSSNYSSAFAFDLNSDEIPVEIWQKMIFGGIQLSKRTTALPFGLNLWIWGNIPIGSGISSSAGMEVALMNLLRKIYNLPLTDKELLLLCQQIENQYLGVKSGLLDQSASLYSRENKFLMLDFASLSPHYMEAKTPGYSWVLADSKVKRELASSKYTERVEETSKALEIVKRHHPEKQSLRDFTSEDLNLLNDPLIRKRATHYLEENERVKESMTAAASGNMKELGKLLTLSHESLKNNYEVSCTELDYLASKAVTIKGCEGARMMGGGFGGCTLNLVRNKHINTFSESLRELYKKKFNIETTITVLNLVDGAKVFPTKHPTLEPFSDI